VGQTTTTTTTTTTSTTANSAARCLFAGSFARVNREYRSLVRPHALQISQKSNLFARCAVLCCAVLCCVVLRRARTESWRTRKHESERKRTKVYPPPLASLCSFVRSFVRSPARACVRACVRALVCCCVVPPARVRVVLSTDGLTATTRAACGGRRQRSSQLASLFAAHTRTCFVW